MASSKNTGSSHLCAERVSPHEASPPSFWHHILTQTHRQKRSPLMNKPGLWQQWDRERVALAKVQPAVPATPPQASSLHFWESSFSTVTLPSLFSVMSWAIWSSFIFWLFLPQGIRSGYSKIKNKIYWALQRLHYKLGGNEKMGLNR